MAEVRDITSPVVARYRGRAAALGGTLPGLSELRGAAAARLDKTLPLGKTESWKYTDLRRYFRSDFVPAESGTPVTADAIAPHLIAGAAPVVFVDGQFVPELSDLSAAPGATIQPFSQAGGAISEVGAIADLDRPGLIALNTALMSDGVTVRVDRGALVETPVQLLFLTSADFNAEAHLRVVLSLAENASATVIETHAALGNGAGLINNVVEFSVGQGASLRHIALQQAAAGVHHIVARAGRLEKDSRFTAFQMATGAALSRSETVLSLAGQGADASLSGIALMRGRQHCDVTTDIAHDVPHCHSDQTFKNVVDERGRTVFQGRVYVAPDAQATDAHQLNRNLLLSRDAQADTKPELVIHADDVKCSHGATVGDLEEDALFYLQSRGIPASEARSLLIKGFAAELFDSIDHPGIAATLEAVLNDWLDTDGKERAAA